MVELIDLVNSKDFTQMENSPTWIPNYGSHSPTLLDLFLSSEASICSVVAFPPLETLIMLTFLLLTIDFSAKSKVNVPFYCTAYGNFRGDWDHLGDVPCEDIFKLSACTVGAGFCECLQVGMDVYIPNLKYQVKLHLCFC